MRAHFTKTKFIKKYEDEFTFEKIPGQRKMFLDGSVSVHPN